MPFSFLFLLPIPHVIIMVTDTVSSLISIFLSYQQVFGKSDLPLFPPSLVTRILDVGESINPNHDEV